MAIAAVAIGHYFQAALGLLFTYEEVILGDGQLVTFGAFDGVKGVWTLKSIYFKLLSVFKLLFDNFDVALGVAAC